MGADYSGELNKLKTYIPMPSLPDSTKIGPKHSGKCLESLFKTISSVSGLVWVSVSTFH